VDVRLLLLVLLYLFGFLTTCVLYADFSFRIASKLRMGNALIQVSHAIYNVVFYEMKLFYHKKKGLTIIEGNDIFKRVTNSP